MVIFHPKTPPPAQTARIIPVPPARLLCALALTLAVIVAVVYRPTLASGRQRTSPHSFAGSLPVRGAASRPRHRRRRPGPRSLVVDRPTQTSCCQRTSPHCAAGIACPLGCLSRRSRRLCSLLPQRIPLRSRHLAPCGRLHQIHIHRQPCLVI